MSTRRTRPGETILYPPKLGTTTVPNAMIFDERLGYLALGLLMTILARPEKAPQGYRAYMRRGVGQDAILTAFKQLAAAGYRHQIMRHAADGRVETYTIVAMEPVPAKVAKDWLEERLKDESRAWHSRARSDLQKYALRQRESGETAGDAVHGKAAHGPPMHGPAVHGEAVHIPTGSKGTSTHYVREVPGEETKADDNPQAECEHGEPLGLNAAGVIRCPQCRQRAKLAAGKGGP